MRADYCKEDLGLAQARKAMSIEGHSFLTEQNICLPIYEFGLKVFLFCLVLTGFLEKKVKLGFTSACHNHQGSSIQKSFGPKVVDQPSIFRLTSIWSSTVASKSEAPKSALLDKSCSNGKSSWICYTTFKSFSNKSTRIFHRLTFVAG